MPNNTSSILNIAIVGGGIYCKEILEKSSQDYSISELKARFVAVADTDPDAPGMQIARKMGLITVNDYHQLYDTKYNIELISILTPDHAILDDILETKPSNIRLFSYKAFELFWRAIAVEEKKLRKRNEEVETILNGIQDFIVVITPDLRIVEVNDSFLKKTGFQPQQVIGKKCHEIFQKIDHQCNQQTGISCPLNEVIRNKRFVQQVLTRPGKNGKKRYVEVSTYPVWEKDGKISKFVEISRDITQRKLEEEEITKRLESMVAERTRELQETHDKLLHQDKMASLGKLSASVVHEINNPIAGILNLTMLMKRIIEDGIPAQKEIDQFSQYLDLMETETRRISRIISNLLAFSRQSRMELKLVNINHLIEKTLFLNSNLLKLNNIKIKRQLRNEIPDIIGSEDQLQQVFMNFISNAVEGMAPHGNGVLSLSTNYDAKEDHIIIRIKDSGSGIPSENFSKLFVPFFTTKKKGKGVGLGLSVAYGIIKEHNGSIYVNSKMKKGTTFKINLPLKQPSDTLQQHGGLHEQH